LASYPPGLSAAFDDLARRLPAELDEDQKERLLRWACKDWGRRDPDEYRFILTADGEQRQALPSAFVVAARRYSDARRAVLQIESPLDEDSPRPYLGEEWTFEPSIRFPKDIRWKSRTPPLGQLVGILTRCSWLYQLDVPAAPTVTGTAGVTAYVYKAVAIDPYGGHSASSAASATFLGGAGNRVITGTVQRGAASYEVWRVTGGVDQGYLGVVASDPSAPATPTWTFTDTGAAALTVGSPPTTNTSESGVPDGDWETVGGLIAVAQFCLEIISLNRNNLPGGAFGAAPKDWQLLVDNAKLLRAELLADLAARISGGVAGISPATTGTEKGVISVGYVEEWMEPLMGVYR
jgi:hypothetical protein